MPVEIAFRVDASDFENDLERLSEDQRARLKVVTSQAAQAARSAAVAATPVKTGRAKAAWSLSAVQGGLRYLLVNNDDPPKTNWLEGRFRMARRAEAAAAGVFEGAGFGNFGPYDFTPLW